MRRGGLGWVRLGDPWNCRQRLGGLVVEFQGKARNGWHGGHGQSWRGRGWPGTARVGVAWYGRERRVRQGTASEVYARAGEPWIGTAGSARDAERSDDGRGGLGDPWRYPSRRGAAGRARQGTARVETRGNHRLGVVWHGGHDMARMGPESLGKAVDGGAALGIARRARPRWGRLGNARIGAASKGAAG